ncbi:ATPase [Vibrio phage K479]
MPVNSVKAREFVEDCLQANLVPFLKGAPGIGKSSIVHAIAEAFDLKIIDTRLSQADPTDLNGFPKIENGKATYMPFDTFPIVGDELPKRANYEADLAECLKQGDFTQQDVDNNTGNFVKFDTANRHSGWLLFLDEFNSAPLSVQAAAYKLVLDHEVGKHPLHENVRIVCAGNRDCDNAITTALSTAMLSRVVHIEMDSDAELWDAWAFGAGIHHMIRDYIKYKPENVNNFDPEQTDDTFGCERTWEFANKLIQVWNGKIPASKLPLLQGTIGMGLAQEFYNYTQVYKEIADYATICANPKGTPVPQEPDRMFALTGVIANGSDAATIGQAMDFVLRMPLEFQVITLKDVIKKDPAMANDPAVKTWVSANMNSLF